MVFFLLNEAKTRQMRACAVALMKWKKKKERLKASACVGEARVFNFVVQFFCVCVFVDEGVCESQQKTIAQMGPYSRTLDRSLKSTSGSWGLPRVILEFAFLWCRNSYSASYIYITMYILYKKYIIKCLYY